MEFPAFPYKPYSIQLDFMKYLYQSLDRGGISMLESPTGTGKTLSIICSAMQWLIDRKKMQSVNGNANEKLGVDIEDDEPDWMKSFTPNQEPNLVVRKKPGKTLDIGVRLGRKKGNDEIEVGNDYMEVQNSKLKAGIAAEDDEEFLVEEYDSEGENDRTSKRKNGGLDDAFSSEEDNFGEDEEEVKLKIYFCSRTHSQLSQLVKEFRKTKFATDLKIVCLGSRKNFCINEDIKKLGNPTRINERCLDLQKNKNKDTSKMKKLDGAKKVRCKKSSRCPMLGSRKIEEFRSEIDQLEAQDIEDLVRIGKNLGACPYYGSRKMLPSADLVALPYQSILSKSSRESLGLNLKNSVIIIDEAHNLADALTTMYDAKVTVPQLNHLQSHLNGYFRRFCDLLGPGNRRYIQTLMVLTRAFLKILCDDKGNKTASVSSMTVNEFLFALEIDNINLVKLLQYMKESKIIYKVSGYGDKVAISHKVSAHGDNEPIDQEESALSGFRALVDMLSSLTNRDCDGKIIISRPRETTCQGQGEYIKYIMLTGEKMFSQVVDEAHAVILVGGTLRPIEETKERLFPKLREDQLHFFSCGHIIPPENILPIAVKQGPSCQPFDFSYKSRSTPCMMEELGVLLSNVAVVVPEGVIVFFSSFDYEAKVYDAWKISGIISRIAKKKHIFREPRKSTEIESVLKEYKEAIDTRDPASSCNGAILFAVVGGKISEGINFSDDMGRCIVMVGLPYPSPSDIELIERVKHIEGVSGEYHTKGDLENAFQILRSCKGRGKDYYENLCMKAVNQSIGRAIRHMNDYAAILLVDARYVSDSTKRSFSHPTNKLPQWIQSRLVSTSQNYGEVHKLLHQFFRFHKSKAEQ